MKSLLLTLFAIIFLVTSSSGEDANSEGSLLDQLADKLSKSFGANLTNGRLDAVFNAINDGLPELKLDKPAGDAQKYLQNRELANKCYNATLNGEEVNVYLNSKIDIMKKYFVSVNFA